MARPNSVDELDQLPSLLNLSIEDAVAGLQSGAFTSVDLVQAYLKRIDESSEFRAVLQVNPDAVEVAKQLDVERSQPLHGIPILIKDNIATKDQLDVSAGSFALLGAKPLNESSLVSKLRSSGALILGKTNMSEWANFRSLKFDGGWSPRGGQTLGIYYPNQRPDGSSCGSAVAAALGLATAAIGTETSGSILDPAQESSVIGFKASRGLIATDRVIPISKRQDIIGTLTRTVKDAAYMLNTMAGRSEADDRTWNIPFDHIPDYTEYCRSSNLKGVTIGIPRNTWAEDAPKPVMTSFQSSLDLFRSLGASIVENANFPAAEEFKKLNAQVKGIVRSSEFKRDIVQYLGTLETNPNNIHTVEDIIEFTKSNKGEKYPERDIGKFLWTQEEGIDVDSDKYKEMVRQELFYGGEGGITGTMDKYGLDVLVVPSTFGIINDLAAKMGFPTMAIPLGYWPPDTPVEYDDRQPGLVKRAPGLPYCLSLISRAYGEHAVFQVAYAFEQTAKVRESGPSPIKAPTTELRDVKRTSRKI